MQQLNAQKDLCKNYQIKLTQNKIQIQNKNHKKSPKSKKTTQNKSINQNKNNIPFN